MSFRRDKIRSKFVPYTSRQDSLEVPFREAIDSMDTQAYWEAVQHIASLDKRFKLNKRVGWVYAFLNRSFTPRMYKIGETSRPPHLRAKELSSETGVPTNYEMAYFVHVLDRIQAEQIVHQYLSEYRVAGNKEFFTASLSLIVSVFDKVARLFPNYGKKGKGAYLVPQVFREQVVECPACLTMNRIKELGVKIRPVCKNCGIVLVAEY